MAFVSLEIGRCFFRMGRFLSFMGKNVSEKKNYSLKKSFALHEYRLFEIFSLRFEKRWSVLSWGFPKREIVFRGSNWKSEWSIRKFRYFGEIHFLLQKKREKLYLYGNQKCWFFKTLKKISLCVIYFVKNTPEHKVSRVNMNNIIVSMYIQILLYKLFH